MARHRGAILSDTDTEILERLVTALREYRATLDVAARRHLADVLDGRGLSIAGVTEDPEHDQGARLADRPTLAETRTSLDWCPSCEHEAGTDRTADGDCASCGTRLTASPDTTRRTT